jgi:NADPH2 dehydrogenase
MNLLFSPFQIKNVILKNRIVMSPMCMYSCYNEDGLVTDWHKVHYTSRAVGQVGLIIVEASAVTPQGRISVHDLGIWSDDHIKGLSELVELAHSQGAKIGIQLAHAGRKAQIKEPIIAPSAIPFQADWPVPKEMDHALIKETVEAFRLAARRARMAGFDVIEIHAAHGYLIHQFLSPLTNHRQDHYGGSKEARYRFLQEVLEAVKTEWSGPLFVRISASDYHPSGLTVDDYVYMARWMKEQGVDLIDCSSGGLVPVEIKRYPGYQVPFAEKIKQEAGIATGAVGLITHPVQAEEILQNQRADLILLARQLLRDPYWPLRAAYELNETLKSPPQYERGWNFL